MFLDDGTKSNKGADVAQSGLSGLVRELGEGRTPHDCKQMPAAGWAAQHGDLHGGPSYVPVPRKQSRLEWDSQAT